MLFSKQWVIESVFLYTVLEVVAKHIFSTLLLLQFMLKEKSYYVLHHLMELHHSYFQVDIQPIYALKPPFLFMRPVLAISKRMINFINY